MIPRVTHTHTHLNIRLSRGLIPWPSMRATLSKSWWFMVPLLSLRSGSFAEISEAALGAEEHGPIAEEGSPGTGATTGPRQLVYPATLNKHIDVAVHLAAGRRTLALQLLLPFLLAGGPGMVDSGVNMCQFLAAICWGHKANRT